MTVDEFLDRLDDAKPVGDGQWLARCPGHDDRRPSLAVGLGNDERVLLNCYAGCTSEEIVHAMNLTLADLFVGQREGAVGRKSTTSKSEPRRKKAVPPEELPNEEELAAWQKTLLDNGAALIKIQQLKGWSPGALRKLNVGVCDKRLSFPIRDATGQLLNVVKYKPRPADGESKSLALRGRPRGLFPAPESAKGGVIWLVEGEPDAVSGATLGLSAVAVPGVKGWKSDYATRFAGRKVVVCMDCDEPGRTVAQSIADDLLSVGVEHQVLNLDPERSDGFDLGDYLTTPQVRTREAGESPPAACGRGGGTQARAATQYGGVAGLNRRIDPQVRCLE